MIKVPNLVQTNSGFKEVKNVKVGDLVLSNNEWKRVDEPPIISDCLKFKLSGGFSITVEKKAVNPHQKSFVMSTYRLFSEKYNKGFYAIPYFASSGFVRFDNNDSRLYKAIICLTREVLSPMGKIGTLKPISVNDDEFSIGSCLELLEGLVNRNLRTTKKGNVIFKNLDEFSALVLSLLNIDVWKDDEMCLVAPHSLYRLFGLVRESDVDIPHHIFEKAIKYKTDERKFYNSISKESVRDWCIKGLSPDINGCTMMFPKSRHYWDVLLNGKKRGK